MSKSSRCIVLDDLLQHFTCFGVDDTAAYWNTSKARAMVLPEARVIEQDVMRTRGMLPFFRRTKIRLLMRQILLKYCTHHNLRYMQGLNEILAPILLLSDRKNDQWGVCDEEDPEEEPENGSSVDLNEEWDSIDSYGLKFLRNIALFERVVQTLAPAIFTTEGVTALQSQLAYLHLMLYYFDAPFASYLSRQLMTTDIYGPSWFITLFARRTAPQLALYVWKLLLFHEKPYLIVFVAIAFLKSHKEELMQLKSEHLPETIVHLCFSSTQEIDDVFQVALDLEMTTPRSVTDSIRKLGFDPSLPDETRAANLKDIMYQPSLNVVSMDLFQRQNRPLQLSQSTAVSSYQLSEISVTAPTIDDLEFASSSDDEFDRTDGDALDSSQHELTRKSLEEKDGQPRNCLILRPDSKLDAAGFGEDFLNDGGCSMSIDDTISVSVELVEEIYRVGQAKHKEDCNGFVNVSSKAKKFLQLLRQSVLEDNHRLNILIVSTERENSSRSYSTPRKEATPRVAASPGIRTPTSAQSAHSSTPTSSSGSVDCVFRPFQFMEQRNKPLLAGTDKARVDINPQPAASPPDDSVEKRAKAQQTRPCGRLAIGLLLLGFSRVAILKGEEMSNDQILNLLDLREVVSSDGGKIQSNLVERLPLDIQDLIPRLTGRRDAVSCLAFQLYCNGNQLTGCHRMSNNLIDASVIEKWEGFPRAEDSESSVSPRLRRATSTSQSEGSPRSTQVSQKLANDTYQRPTPRTAEPSFQCSQERQCEIAATSASSEGTRSLPSYSRISRVTNVPRISAQLVELEKQVRLLERSLENNGRSLQYCSRFTRAKVARGRSVQRMETAPDSPPNRTESKPGETSISLRNPAEMRSATPDQKRSPTPPVGTSTSWISSVRSIPSKLELAPSPATSDKDSGSDRSCSTPTTQGTNIADCLDSPLLESSAVGIRDAISDGRPSKPGRPRSSLPVSHLPNFRTIEEVDESNAVDG